MQSFIGTNLTISGDGGGGPPPGPTAYPPTLSATSGSMYFTGSNGHYYRNDSPQDWAVGTGDYTVEWYQWMLSTSSNVSRVFSVGTWPSCKLGLSIEGGGSIFYLWAEGAGFNNAVGYITPDVNDVLNTWLHIAISRVSGTTKIFLNGVEAYSTTNNYNVTNPSNEGITVGNHGDLAAPFNGYIKDFRFIKGVGLYNGGFEPPKYQLGVTTETVLLLSANDSNSVDVDSSANNHFTGTTGGLSWSDVSPYGIAIELDAANSSSYDSNNPTAWLDLSPNANHITLTNVTNPGPGTLNFGTTGHGESTTTLTAQNGITPRISISLWATINNSGYFQHIAGFRGYNKFHIVLLNNNANLECRLEGTNGFFDLNPVISTGLMTHYAFVANGDRTDVYINGVMQGTTSITGTFTGTLGNFNIGQVLGDFQSNNLDVSYVRVDNRARSPREIFQEYDRTRGNYGL